MFKFYNYPNYIFVKFKTSSNMLCQQAPFCRAQYPKLLLNTVSDTCAMPESLIFNSDITLTK